MERQIQKIYEESFVKFKSEQMFSLVNDIKSYPEFIPWCKKAAVIDGQLDQWMLAKLTFEFHGIKQSFTTHNKLIDRNTIDIKLINGPFEHLDGKWHFDDHLDGCKIIFVLEYTFSQSWLSTIFEPAFKQVSEILLDSFIKRAHDIYGKDSN